MSSAGTQEHYVWNTPESLLTVYLDFQVIDQLGVDVMRGFGAVRRRGTEVGGILLGTIDTDRNAVHVQRYEPIPCEYSQGPSYLLSEHDEQGFRETVHQWAPQSGRDLRAVGYYRSHTRDEFSLDAADLQLFGRYFPHPTQVALLIKPFATKASQAAFFVQRDGVLRGESSPLAFPFRRKELGGGAPERNTVPDPARRPTPRRGAPEPQRPTREPPAQIPTPDPPEPEHRKIIVDHVPMFTQAHAERSVWRARVAFVAFVIALLAFGAVAGWQFAGGQVAHSTATPSSEAYALNLTASRSEGNVLVHWDKDSPAIKQGWRGVLTITVGQDSKNVQLDVPQLQNGSVLYRHMQPEATFRLEVFLKERRSLVETISWRAAP